MTPGKHYERWNDRDDEYLAENYLKRDVAAVAQKLGRSVYAVRRRIIYLGLSRRIYARPWRTYELRFLREHYSTMGAKWCGLRLGRTPQSVRCAAKGIGLRPPSKWRWRDDEETTLREMWRQHEHVNTISAQLGRSAEAVKLRAMALGLRRRKSVKKPPEA